jgi:activator of HSP90 ATPase
MNRKIMPTEKIKNQFTLSIILPVDQKRLYLAWLSGKEHSAFTGSPAKVIAKKGGVFSAWDGYISGKTIKMEPYHQITQIWRTTEFPADAPDSTLEILIDKVKDGSKLTLVHRGIPNGKAGEYKKGWKDFYFSPMKKYFIK